MVASFEGAIWADYWQFRADIAEDKRTVFDAAIAALHEVRTEFGTKAPESDIALFDALVAVMAGLAMRRTN